MVEKMNIDFATLTEPGILNISGHERGVQARLQFELDRVDEVDGVVGVHIPEDVRAIATSFFQGMFSKSVQKYGSKDIFLSHYHFDATPNVMEQILRGIDRSLTQRGGAVFAN